ncbi:MAG: cohesin domain-containing protein [Lachnospiraceae bacterium]
MQKTKKKAKMSFISRLKSLMVVLALVIINTVSINTVSHAQGEVSHLTMTSTKTAVDANDEITVTVNLNMTSGVTYDSLDFKIRYKLEEFEYLGYTACSPYTIGTVSSSPEDSTFGLISWNSNISTDNGINASGEIVKLSFKVKKVNSTTHLNFAQVLYSQDVGHVTIESEGIDFSCAHGNKHESVEVRPGCEQSGRKAIVCDNCSVIVRRENISPTGHTPGEWTEVTSPSCLEAGSKEKSCSACQQVLEREVIAATGHTYGTWTIVKSATVDEEGREERICANCGMKETRVLDKLDSPIAEEKTTEEQTTEKQSTKEQTAETSIKEDKSGSPNTGDSVPLYYILPIMLLSFAGLYILLKSNKKKY